MIVLAVPAAQAQSPTPTKFMEDSAPNGTPYPHGAAAIVVEGLGAIGGCAYSESRIESWTVKWLHQSARTVTEITPQTACGSLGSYESLLTRINTYVERYGRDPAHRWGGFMRDEEPGYGFSAAQLILLNKYVDLLVGLDPGQPQLFTEDQPNGWSVPTYYGIISLSTPSPQVYTATMANAVNQTARIFEARINMVTIGVHTHGIGYPWNNPGYVTRQVIGTPWGGGPYWTFGYWDNYYRDQ